MTLRGWRHSDISRMTSTSGGTRIGGCRRKVARQKLGLTLLFASSLLLAIRTANLNSTHSDRLSQVESDGKLGHSVAVGDNWSDQVSSPPVDYMTISDPSLNSLMSR